MGRPQQTFSDNTLNGLAERVLRLERILSGDVEFGAPQDPNDPASTALPDGAVHNGTLTNMRGSWVEVELDDPAQRAIPLTFTHNLNVQVVSATLPNVRWLLFGIQHTAALAVAESAAVWYNGGTVARNSIELEVTTSATPSGGDPLKLTLFFVPGVR